MLGINRQDEQPPPLPLPPSSACSTNNSHLVQQQQNFRRHHRHHPSLDASPSTSSSVSSIQLPSSPLNSESRPTTSSSLRPFPFLGGIRRKSANSTALKSPHPLNNNNTFQENSSPIVNLFPNLSPHAPSISSITITNDKKETLAHTQLSDQPSLRVYTHGSAKKAQSADDLSQFGLLPKQRIQPRRSEELFENRQTVGKSSAPPCASSSASTDGDRQDPSNIHNGLDQIGELAGSLAGMSRSSGIDDRQPRLSNPKGMRTGGSFFYCSVYGVPIEDLYWRDGDTFPSLVNVLVQLIEEKGIDQQGIYRVPGEKRVIENLQASIDEKGVQGVDIWHDSYRDVHNLSGALKLFLREIPGGVIPFDRYDRFLAVNGIADESERTSQLQAHVRDLPIPNKILLIKLVKHFERVVAHAESNSMLAHNVAIVFAPSLFRNGSEHSNPLLSMQNIGKASAIVRQFVLNASKIFKESSEDLMKQGAMEMMKRRTESQHQRESKRRSINMNLNKANDQSTGNHHLDRPTRKEDPRRASVGSVKASSKTDELKKQSKRDSLNSKKKNSSNNNNNNKSSTGSSKGIIGTTSNTNESNNGISSTTKGGKNRHSLSGSVLSSSTSRNSSSAAKLKPAPRKASTSSSNLSFPSPASYPQLVSSQQPSATSPTPHPQGGLGNMIINRKKS